MDELDQATLEREQEIIFNEIDRRVDLLLANYQAVTSNPRSMGYLRFLLKHYAKKAHPWKECFKDNFKRFGPKTAGLCAVLKDTIRQSTHWRGHPGEDHGAPGVAIGDADKNAATAWGGHHLSAEDGCPLDQAFMQEFPGVKEVPGEVFEILFDLGKQCSVTRVLLGLEEAPHISLEEAP